MNMTAPKQTARPQERGGRPTAEAAVAAQHSGQTASGTSGAGATMPTDAVFALEHIQ